MIAYIIEIQKSEIRQYPISCIWPCRARLLNEILRILSSCRILLSSAKNTAIGMVPTYKRADSTKAKGQKSCTFRPGSVISELFKDQGAVSIRN